MSHQPAPANAAPDDHPAPDWFPELAEDPRRATRAPGTAIEVTPRWSPPRGRIRHAVFDHDGTLSTLRHGWERVMETMMLRAILGGDPAGRDPALVARATAEVRAYIDGSTGVQTLVQMQGLVELVRRFGCVPAAAIRDHHHYKAAFNDELMAVVRARAARLAAGEVAPADFQIVGARRWLERLRAAGVVLHLASGTDQGDLVAEAEAMGYADLFDGGIHGAVGDVAIEAKREVMDRVVREAGGAPFAVFGDGPVEIREGGRRGAVCIGIAADEARRTGVDPIKRRRLIHAGAGLVLEDYAEDEALLAQLGLGA